MYTTKIEFFEQNIYGEYGRVEPHVWGIDNADSIENARTIDHIVKTAIEVEEFANTLPVLVLVTIMEGDRNGKPIEISGWCLNSMTIVRTNTPTKHRVWMPNDTPDIFEIDWSESSYSLDRASLTRFNGLTDLA